MRRPRNLDQYLPAKQAAQALRDYADDLERRAEPGEMLRITFETSRWNEAWREPPPATQPLSAQSQSQSPATERQSGGSEAGG